MAMLMNNLYDATRKLCVMRHREYGLKIEISIYGLKKSSRQWYHKFHKVIISINFEVNVIEDCVYHKFSGNKCIFLVLYVDDILFATNDICMIHKTKKILLRKFEVEDLDDTFFVLGIQIH